MSPSNILPKTPKRTQLIKSITTAGAGGKKGVPLSTAGGAQQKTISVFLTQAKDTGPHIEGKGKESLEDRRERMLRRIREKKAVAANEKGVQGGRELRGSYERGEWCISGLFLYLPLSFIPYPLTFILYPSPTPFCLLFRRLPVRKLSLLTLCV